MTANPIATNLVCWVVGLVMCSTIGAVVVEAFQLRSALRAEQTRFYDLVTWNLRDMIDTAAMAGTTPRLSRSTQDLIQRSRAGEPGVLSITVFDAEGNILYDTDRFRIGSRLPVAWVPPAPSTQTWETATADAGLVGTRLAGAIGGDGGGVVVNYDLTAMETRFVSALLVFVRAAILAVGIAALCAAVVVFALTKPLRRALIGTMGNVVNAGATRDRLVDDLGLGAAVGAADTGLAQAETALMRLGTAQSHAA